MKFAVRIANTLLTVVNVQKESNTTCCSGNYTVQTQSHSAGSFESQHGTQYADKNRHPFEPFKPVVPSTPAPLRSFEKDTPSQIIFYSAGRRQFGSTTAQFQTQYKEQNRYSSKSYKPIIPKSVVQEYPDEPVDNGSPSISDTPLIIHSATFIPTTLRSVVSTEHLQFNQNERQYQTQYKEQNHYPFEPYEPTVTDIAPSVSSNAFTTATKSAESPAPDQAQTGPLTVSKVDSDIENSSKNQSYTISQAQGNYVSQYNSQYNEPYRPFQPYKPFIPLTQASNSTFDPVPPVFPAPSASSDSFAPRGPSLGQLAYGHDQVQYHSQYMSQHRDPYEPYKPIIPTPFKTTEPVSAVSSTSYITPGDFVTANVSSGSPPILAPVQPAPVIDINIFSNGRTFFDDFNRRNDTLPFIKILINNVYNYNNS